MYEIPVVAWIAAAAVAVVVLAFCGYEVWWKARRLQRDLARLQALQARAGQLQSDIAAVQSRVRNAAVPAGRD